MRKLYKLVALFLVYKVHPRYCAGGQATKKLINRYHRPHLRHSRRYNPRRPASIYYIIKPPDHTYQFLAPQMVMRFSAR